VGIGGPLLQEAGPSISPPVGETRMTRRGPRCKGRPEDGSGRSGGETLPALAIFTKVHG